MTSNIDSKQFIAVIPQLKSEIERYSFLQNGSSDPVRVAVFGKYNHGKSTLLNAVVGQDGVFKASDARETVKNQDFFDKDRNIIWVDTPGLDADSNFKDDVEAKAAVITKADIILLVHNVKTGELDKYEVDYYRSLLQRKTEYKSCVFLLLTQIDQIDPAQLPSLLQIINKQMPELTTLQVSATRYIKGVKENKSPLVERSGILALLAMTKQWPKQVQELRNAEIRQLRQALQNALVQKRYEALAMVKTHRATFTQRESQFRQEVQNFVTSIQAKL